MERDDSMIRVILEIEGMKCGMCEAHVNDIIRKNVKSYGLKTSHSKNKSKFVIDDNNKDKIDLIIQAIEKDGYRILNRSIEENAKKKGLFW